MPLIKISCSNEISEDTKTAMAGSLASAIANTTGKPREYIMVLIEDSKFLRLGDRAGSALIEYSQIGELEKAKKSELAAILPDTLRKYSVAPPERTYIVFGEFARENWGHDGKTFAE